jgi:hypothetical protein
MLFSFQNYYIESLRHGVKVRPGRFRVVEGKNASTLNFKNFSKKPV